MRQIDNLIQFIGRLVIASTMAIAGGYAGAQEAIQPENSDAKIESSLLQTLQSKGSSAIYIHFAQQADLSGVYAHPLDWHERGQYVYDTLVATAEASQAEAIQFLDAAGLKHTTFIIGNLLYVNKADIATVKALARIPGVTALTEPKTYQIDPPIINKAPGPRLQPSGSLAWGITDTKADQFWNTYSAKGAGIVVANIDTGVQWNHPALDQAYKCGTSPADPKCWKDPSNICGASGACDNNGHGTHTMGTMVGDDDPSLTWQAGMAPDAKWIACKGCESNSCSDFALNTCADWLLAPGGSTANRPHVVNNSWGGGGGNAWYATKVAAWRAAGIFPAFSAGNSGSGCGTLGSPGDYQGSFASAAHDSARQIAYFSSRGPSAYGHDPYTKSNLSAPGVNVCSTLPNSGWSCGYSGTSMASPHSAGAVALLWSCNANLIGKIDETFQALQAEADTPPAGNCGAPPDGQGNYTYGYGYLNVLAAGAACGGPLPGKLVVNPTALSSRLKLGKTQTLPLTLTNTGGKALTFKITEQSVTAETVMAETAGITLPPFTGVIPPSDVPSSIEQAPIDDTARLSAATRVQEQPLGTLAGAPAYAVDIYPGENLVKLPSVDVPGTWTVVANKPSTAYFAGDFIGGDFSKLYAIDYESNQLHSLNTATGATTVIGAATPPSGQRWTGMSGGSNGIMYASSTTCGSSTLSKVDLKTGAVTAIGPISNGPCIIDIAITPDASAIYGVDIVSDVLVRIDPETGAGTVVGSVGINANYAQGMDFDDASGILYWAAYNPSGSGGEMRVIDTKTGNSALVGAFPSGAETDAFGIATGGIANVPWLDETPKSGTLAAEAKTVVNVSFKSNLTGMKPGVYKAKLNIQTNTPDGTLSVPVQMTVIDGRDLAVDFGSQGLWIYTLNDLATTVEGAGLDGAWDKISSKNASALVGWTKGLAADLDTEGLWNYSGTTWTKIDTRNVGNGGLASWSKGLAADYDALGLWNYNGTTWAKIDTRNVGNGGLASWSKGLAADYDALGLWNYNGTSWTKIDTRNVGNGGLAGWSKGLAADYDALGLWNYNGTTWTKIDTRNVGDGGLIGWSKGLAVDYDGLGLWNYNGIKWTRLTTWNPGAGGMSDSAAGLTVDFDGRGVWNFDGLVWRRLVSGMDAQGMSTVTLPMP